MKKFILLLAILSLVLLPQLALGATGLIQCGNTVVDGKVTDHCTILDIFSTILRIYNFAVWTIAIPLAAFLVVIGGIFLLISGGNPGLAEKGKNILKYTFIALLLIFGSWLIIDVVLKTIGYPLKWWEF